MHGVMEYKMIFNSLEVIDDVVNKNKFFCFFLLEGHRFVFEVSLFFILFLQVNGLFSGAASTQL